MLQRTAFVIINMESPNYCQSSVESSRIRGKTMKLIFLISLMLSSFLFVPPVLSEEKERTSMPYPADSGDDVIPAVQKTHITFNIFAHIPHIEIESGFPRPPKVLNYKEYHIFKG
ncbi:MAG: hypothetical protein U9P14_07935 [Gemmatimonadota bacterium]|nr:hypothetical protein [Gemmatimonadota bacterium]